MAIDTRLRVDIQQKPKLEPTTTPVTPVAPTTTTTTTKAKPVPVHQQVEFVGTKAQEVPRPVEGTRGGESSLFALQVDRKKTQEAKATSTATAAVLGGPRGAGATADVDKIGTTAGQTMGPTEVGNMKDIAREFGVTIHVAGRWADDAGDRLNRRVARRSADTLAKRWGFQDFDDVKANGGKRLFTIPGTPPQQQELLVWKVLQSEVRARFEAERGILLAPWQVKVSTGGSELDVVLSAADNQKLERSGRIEELRETLKQAFGGVDVVDFYQHIPDAPEYAPFKPDTPPPNSVAFGPDGGEPVRGDSGDPLQHARFATSTAPRAKLALPTPAW
ncbi:MAG: hypothetical protein Q8O67_01560 [Deltaproteobacteria bacterium]|nr:hypothetical protein [Deltaproteobacteria bacterium]